MTPKSSQTLQKTERGSSPKPILQSWHVPDIVARQRCTHKRKTTDPTRLMNPDVKFLNKVLPN